jgi:hypothetical protein
MKRIGRQGDGAWIVVDGKRIISGPFRYLYDAEDALYVHKQDDTAWDNLPAPLKIMAIIAAAVYFGAGLVAPLLW